MVGTCASNPTLNLLKKRDKIAVLINKDGPKLHFCTFDNA